MNPIILLGNLPLRGEAKKHDEIHAYFFKVDLKKQIIVTGWCQLDIILLGQ